MTLQLLQLVAAGDASGIPLVLDRYSGLVWSLACRASPNRADAEDAVQEIFTEIWRNAGRFDPSVASEATFIAMIARRRLIDRRRRANRRITSNHTLDQAGATAAAEPTFDVGEDARLALDALEGLDPDQQRALRLSLIQGLSHEKIAEVTGLPLGTVKTCIRRGLIRIREAMESMRSSRRVGAQR